VLKKPRLQAARKGHRDRRCRVSRLLPPASVTAAVLLATLAGDVRGEVVDRVIATIDGEPITQHDLETYTRERRLPMEPSRDALDILVTERLLAKEAAARGITVRSEDTERYIAEIKARRGLDDKAFERALRERGITLEDYEREVRAELERAELINREIRGRVSVSPEEVRRHYDAHGDDYTVAERVRIRMILIPVPPDASPADASRAEALISELHARIVNGADFAEFARRYSRGPGARDGGDLGFFERGQMVEPLEEVAFRLKAGTLSDPIRSPAGFHLLKVEERSGAVDRPFEEVSDQIRDELYQAALQQRYERWLREDLREAHPVEILW
jgi:parvulin-like peptidyl-prolyl isomerase